MSNIITITSLSVSARVGKNGKASTTSQRAARALNGASGAVKLGLALTGKGEIARAARSSFADSAMTLDRMLSLPMLDGGAWPDMYALLCGELGQAVEADRGKNACFALLEVAQNNARNAQIGALADGTVKQLDAAQARIARLSYIVTRLGEMVTAKQAAIMAEAQKAAESDAATMAESDAATMAESDAATMA